MTEQHAAVSRAYHGIRRLYPHRDVRFLWADNMGVIEAAGHMYEFIPVGEFYLEIHRDTEYIGKVFCGNLTTATLDIITKVIHEN